MKLRDTFIDQTHRQEEKEALKKCMQVLHGPKRKLLQVILEVLSKELKDK